MGEIINRSEKGSEIDIPQRILHKFSQEVKDEIAPMRDFMSEETVEYYEVNGMDIRISTYKILAWLDQQVEIRLALQPGAGFELVPELTLGIGRVVKTSLETYGKKDHKRYYDPDKSENRVIADNKNLPFKKDAFKALLILETTFDIAGAQRDELLRSLKSGGLVVITQSEATSVDDQQKDRVGFYNDSDALKKVQVPDYLQQTGISGATFFVFKKK